MGDEYPGAEKMADVLAAMEGLLPGVMRSITKVQPEVAQTQAEIDAAVSPLYAKTQADIYDTTGRRMNQIGQEIETSNQLAASAREKQIADTYGVDLVSAADRLNRILDPEFYKNRTEVSQGISNALASQDPSKLTSAETEAISRGVARRGNVNPNSTVNTAANAMTFGQALQQKQALFNQTLGTAAGALPSTRTGVNAFEIATRRALTPNTGDSKFVGVQQNTGQNAWNTGNQFMQGATQLQAIKNQKSKDLMDKIQQGTESFSNVMSSFSFM